ncbi:hypothetical protein [Candidatus Cyrtobacter comes]|nr:hypothetical protein [Candidatus Cyrtobacter comes]
MFQKISQSKEISITELGVVDRLVMGGSPNNSESGARKGAKREE